MIVRARTALTLAVFGAALLAAGPLSGQQSGPTRIVPTNAVLITGYGTVGFTYRPAKGEGAVPSAFQTGISPIFLFQFQDRILFEAELEFELEEGVTATNLEYAQADIMVSDNLVLVIGKSLLPFGIFGERIHPSWINKMATAPPLFGHGGTGFGAPPVLGIPRDVGFVARASFPAGPVQIGLNGFVTNGFQAEEHAEEGEEEEEGEIPEVGLLASSEDITNQKMFGGRVDVVLAPWAEINISSFSGTYDARDRLYMTGFDVAGELRRNGFEFRGEYVRTRQDFETNVGISDQVRSGFYSQLSYRDGAWEPVLRYTKIFDNEIDGETEISAAAQTAIGVSYWINPSVAVMSSFEFNREDAVVMDNNRFNIHMAFGF